MIKKGDRVADVLKFIMVILEAPEEAISRLDVLGGAVRGRVPRFFPGLFPAHGRGRS